MKLKKFKEKKTVKASIIGLGCLCLIAVGYLLHRTFASFQTNDTFKMMEGTLDYFGGSDAYFAFYDDGVAVDTMPAKDSGLSFKSAECTNGASVVWNKENWEPTIKNLTKTKTKCTLYFGTPKNLVNEVLKNATGKSNPVEAKQVIEGKGTPDFSRKAETNEGMFAALDDLGTSYYYRGVADNNFVQFAGYYWRIIRINGDGTVRLIYNGPNANQTGESTQIQDLAFNTQYDNPAYVGYMYGSTINSSKEQTQANEINSNMKTFLENWYDEKLNSYDAYIADEIFCNDRSVASGNGYTTNTNTSYGAQNRLTQNKTPILKCPQASDKFTVSETLGNGKNIHPIGLITEDELSMAGGGGTGNETFYLYTGNYYWTMSPCQFFSGDAAAHGWGLSSDGSFSATWVTRGHGVRPVINLKANTEITSGTGTANDPYIVS